MENKLKINENTVVHCPTEELANKVLAIADRLGYRWSKLRSFIDYNYWDNYKQDTCYSLVSGGYSYLSYYQDLWGYPIISAEDFLKLHEEKPTLYYIRGVEDRGEEVINMSKEKRLVYGIAGIAQIFNCSMTTANRIKASGKIDRAISKCGANAMTEDEIDEIKAEAGDILWQLSGLCSVMGWSLKVD